jgi:hypothetical protein
MPRRSLIQPINACLAPSVRKAASGVASSLNATYSEKRIKNTSNFTIYQCLSKGLSTHLLKWFHESPEFHRAILHED